MGKYFVDIDEQTLEQARAELGTTTIEDTVNGALRSAVAQRTQRVSEALDALESVSSADRGDAWR